MFVVFLKEIVIPYNCMSYLSIIPTIVWEDINLPQFTSTKQSDKDF